MLKQPPQTPNGRAPVTLKTAAIGVLGLLTALALPFFLPACSKPEEPPPVPVAPPPTPVPTPKPTPTPTPTPTPASTPTPTPVVRRTAPDGVYYVTEDVTVKLASGLMGIAPGTLVKMIKENGDSLHVSDGTHDFDVAKSKLTNDLATARAIQRANQDAQAAGDSFRAQQEAVEAQKQRDYIEFLRSHPLEAASPTPK